MDDAVDAGIELRRQVLDDVEDAIHTAVPSRADLRLHLLGRWQLQNVNSSRISFKDCRMKPNPGEAK